MHGEGYVTLDCTVDDSYVVVNRNDLGGSHLVADLPQDEEFGTLAVPFTRNAVQAWHAVKKGEHVNLDFVGCIGALKVCLILPVTRVCPVLRGSFPFTLSTPI